jgi:hypothetical protein
MRQGFSDKPFHPTSITCRVLYFLASQRGEWCTWGAGVYMPTVHSVFRAGTTEETQLRFMQRLQRKGLVSGCDCGCRGDYTVTREGLDLLDHDSQQGEKLAQQYRDREEEYGYGY